MKTERVKFSIPVIFKRQSFAVGVHDVPLELIQNNEYFDALEAEGKATIVVLNSARKKKEENTNQSAA